MAVALNLLEVYPPTASHQGPYKLPISILGQLQLRLKLDYHNPFEYGQLSLYTLLDRPACNT